MRIKVLYFAWVREKVGRAQEEIELPETVHTIADLLEWLKAQGEEYTLAFENSDRIRAAINQNHVPHDTLLDGAEEIAFFPPVTGG